jgi:hypothetical protein
MTQDEARVSFTTAPELRTFGQEEGSSFQVIVLVSIP